MAAILPHLEVPHEVTPIERAYDLCVGTLHSETLGEGHPSCPAPEAVLADAHTGLLGMVFVRDAVFETLQDKQFVVHAGDMNGTHPRDVFLVLDQPVGFGPPWNPAVNPDARQYRLLSWTSKMNTPSWSLPAGAPQIGGACPGAVAGQSVVPESALRSAAKYVARGLGRPRNTPVNLPQAICEHCYATGGQYSTGQVQYAQLLRFLWARQAIQFEVAGPMGPSTAFIETMVYAIDAANYRLSGGKVKGEGAEATQDLPPEWSGRRFFRIHDSGDFFEEEYLRQWKMIADRLPDITFWAPSRIWATSWGTEAVNEINREPRNFIVRPSAYEVNEPGPSQLGPGWAGPTTVIAVGQNMGMTLDREQFVASIEHKSAPRTTGPDPRYTWDCVAVGTPVHVQGRGLIEIEVVAPGDRVMTRDGWRNVVCSEARSTKATLVIETTGGQRLRVTHDHQIARPTGWCTADELQPGDKLIAMPEDAGASHGMVTSVPAWDRSVGSRGPAHDAAQFPEFWTRELGLVLGYLTGDAHFRETGVEVEVGLTKHEDLQQLDGIISQWLGHGAKFDERVHHPNGVIDCERMSYRALWHNVQFVRYLQGFGFGQKSPMRRLPKGLFQAPRTAQLGFLAGYLSADGSVTARREGGGEIRAFTTSASMATELSLLWSVLGARVSVSIDERKPYKMLYTIMGRSAAALNIAKEAQLLNEEKNAVAQALKVPERTRIRYVSVTQIVDDRLVVPTWDLEVEGENPEFVAGGMLVHNCRAYATDDAKHTCRKAVAPPGLGDPTTGKGCRACWIAPGEIVNYSLH